MKPSQRQSFEVRSRMVRGRLTLTILYEPKREPVRPTVQRVRSGVRGTSGGTDLADGNDGHSQRPAIHNVRIQPEPMSDIDPPM